MMTRARLDHLDARVTWIRATVAEYRRVAGPFDTVDDAFLVTLEANIEEALEEIAFQKTLEAQGRPSGEGREAQ
jgi:hypothetical protein